MHNASLGNCNKAVNTPIKDYPHNGRIKSLAQDRKARILAFLAFAACCKALVGLGTIKPEDRLECMSMNSCERKSQGSLSSEQANRNTQEKEDQVDASGEHSRTIDRVEPSSAQPIGTESDSPPNFETEDPIEIVPPRKNPECRRNKKKPRKKKEFNPWTELDKASRKNVTRRDLITGLFRFLPREDDKK